MVRVAERPDHSRFTTHDSRLRARRACVALAVAAACWSLLALLTGGVSFHLGFLSLSSRNPRNPALAAALMFLAAWTLGDPGSRGQQLLFDLHWIGDGVRRAGVRVWTAWTGLIAWVEAGVPPVAAPLIAIAASAGIVVTAFRESAFVAAGSDAWGYVSQAHLWATGTLRSSEPLMAALSGFLPRDAVAPMAYRPGLDGASIVPVTSPDSRC